MQMENEFTNRRNRIEETGTNPTRTKKHRLLGNRPSDDLVPNAIGKFHYAKCYTETESVENKYPVLETNITLLHIEHSLNTLVISKLNLVSSSKNIYPPLTFQC